MSYLNRHIAPLVFPSVLWHTSESSVHLTFDDGPHPVATPQVLRVLNERKIRATFFLVGLRVQELPTVAREVAAEGHTIGNHSFSHASLMLEPPHIQVDEIRRANDIISETVLFKPRSFRPPYGRFDHNTLRTARLEGQKLILWDVDAKDYRHRDPASIARRVCSQARQGSVVLLHDNDSTVAHVVQTLEQILDGLERTGFRFTPLSL